LNLNGPWRFRFDDALEFRLPHQIPAWPHTIEVPFAPESRRSGIGSTEFHSACWYQRDFELTPTAGFDTAAEVDGRVLLHFGAVDYLAKVWVNDTPMGQHEGGHTPFHFDITDALTPDGPQNVTVYALDDPHDLQKPRGKQDWRLEPHSIWYPRTTGIWQTVWIECVPRTYIEQLTVAAQSGALGDRTRRLHRGRRRQGPRAHDRAQSWRTAIGRRPLSNRESRGPSADRVVGSGYRRFPQRIAVVA
jgi:beta-galactosidase/beta-glucuronidase